MSLATAEEDEERNTVLDHQCYVLQTFQLNPGVCSAWICPCNSGCRERGTEKEIEHLNTKNGWKMFGNVGVLIF